MDKEIEEIDHCICSEWPPSTAYLSEIRVRPRGVRLTHPQSGIRIEVQVMEQAYQNRAIAMAAMRCALKHWGKIR